MKKILIIKTSSLGDIIHAFPALGYLRSKFPDAQIDWVVEKPFSELVSCHPFVSKTICVHTGQWRKTFYRWQTIKECLDLRRAVRESVYDVVFDPQGNTKSAFVLAQARSQHKVGFARKSVFEWPNLLFSHHQYDPPLNQNVRDECLFLVKSFLQDQTDIPDQKIRLRISEERLEKIRSLLEHPEIQQGPKVLVCPGSVWPNKQLTPQVLISFLTLLQNHLRCSYLFLWGSPQEQKSAQELQNRFSHSILVDKLPLPSLQNLMASVNLVVAMDSLPLHLAGTTDTPTFSVFGASSANKYKPKGSEHIAFQGSCPYSRTFERRCPILRSCPTGLCIRGLQGPELFQYYLQRIDK